MKKIIKQYELWYDGLLEDGKSALTEYKVFSNKKDLNIFISKLPKELYGIIVLYRVYKRRYWEYEPPIDRDISNNYIKHSIHKVVLK